MLYLTRKIGESIVINDDIELTVVEIRGKSIKLGLTFPADVSVYRREVFERIQAEKTMAAGPSKPSKPSGALADNSAGDAAVDSAGDLAGGVRAEHVRQCDEDAPVRPRAAIRSHRG